MLLEPTTSLSMNYNIVYGNVGIYNVEQRRVNVFCFKVGMNNV